jgi:hypothetical protein
MSARAVDAATKNNSKPAITRIFVFILLVPLGQALFL